MPHPLRSFEGTIFTYAILKHEVMGIDERLRKGFTAAAFTGFGALSLLIASEAMESTIPGGGLIGGLIVGVPLIALRRPILRAFSSLSTALMPEAHTMHELQYLEVFAAPTLTGTSQAKSGRCLICRPRLSESMRLDKSTWKLLGWTKSHR